MNARPDPTTVEIYGQTYNVRGEGDPEYLTELARFVDSRMRAVASQVPSNDPMRVAILAALNIADEYVRLREQRESTRGIWMEKTQELAERLGRSVADEGQPTEA
jgi:cell division protein ZapA